MGAAAAGETSLRPLEESDAFCRAARLLTLETPPQHRVFRHWYVGELVTQLRAAASGVAAPPPLPFEDRLLQASADDRLAVPGTVGYDEDVVRGLREESPDAELPAAVALRTGQPVWLE